MSAWQPIESAPDSGEPVLFYTPPRSGYRVFQIGRGDDWHNGAWSLEYATHWTPLPTPPKETDDE